MVCVDLVPQAMWKFEELRAPKDVVDGIMEDIEWPASLLHHFWDANNVLWIVLNAATMTNEEIINMCRRLGPYFKSGLLQ